MDEEQQRANPYHTTSEHESLPSYFKKLQKRLIFGFTIFLTVVVLGVGALVLLSFWSVSATHDTTYGLTQEQADLVRAGMEPLASITAYYDSEYKAITLTRQREESDDVMSGYIFSEQEVQHILYIYRAMGGSAVVLKGALHTELVELLNERDTPHTKKVALWDRSGHLYAQVYRARSDNIGDGSWTVFALNRFTGATEELFKVVLSTTEDGKGAMKTIVYSEKDTNLLLKCATVQNHAVPISDVVLTGCTSAAHSERRRTGQYGDLQSFDTPEGMSDANIHRSLNGEPSVITFSYPSRNSMHGQSDQSAQYLISGS